MEINRIEPLKFAEQGAFVSPDKVGFKLRLTVQHLAMPS
jgi:hypothetical protein